MWDHTPEEVVAYDQGWDDAVRHFKVIVKEYFRKTYSPRDFLSMQEIQSAIEKGFDTQ